jgi:broad specificity phosphatase PhoE
VRRANLPVGGYGHEVPVLPFPPRLLLVRHAESVGNVAARRAYELGASRLELEARDADVELSDVGRRQATGLGRWLTALPEEDRPTAVLASPYARAADTARVALAEADLDLEIRTDERLRERDLGIFDGLTGKGYRELHAEEAERRQRLGKLYYRAPGGESWADVALRVRSVLTTLREDYAEDRVLVVSHQAVIMSFRQVLEGLVERELLDIDEKSPLANCSVTRYDRDASGRLRLTVYDDTAPVDLADAPVTEEPEADVRP